MVLRTRARRWRLVGVGAVGALALGACNLGEPPVTYDLADPSGTPLGTNGLASGDIDGDGDLDVVVASADGLVTRLNDGSGSYTPGPRLKYVPTRHPALVDVDGDDDLDLVGTVPVLSEPYTSQPAVFRNDGSGTFAFEPVGDPPAETLTDLVPGDADGDGDDDLLVAARSGQDRLAGAYLNDGTGAFAAPAWSPLGLTWDSSTAAHIVAGDLDGDGDDDVVVADAGDYTTPDGEVVDGTLAVVALSDGTGAFAAGEPLAMGYSNGYGGALVPALGDFTADGVPDLVVGGYAGVTTARGDGTGGLGAPHQHDLGIDHRIDLVTTADVDGDGFDDVVGLGDILDPGTGVVAWADASGSGAFEDAHEVGTGARADIDGGGPTQPAATDLEGDGDVDLLFLAGDLGVVENAVDGRPNH